MCVARQIFPMEADSRSSSHCSKQLTMCVFSCDVADNYGDGAGDNHGVGNSDIDDH